MVPGIEHLLKDTDWFKGLSSQSLTALASASTRKKAAKKEVLFWEGDAGRRLFLLEDGLIRLYKTTAAGKEVVIRIVKPGEIFAEVVLFEQANYPVTAVALKESSLYLWDKRDILAMLGREDFRHDFIRSLLAKHRYLTDRIVCLAAEDVEERFFLFLLDHVGRAENISPPMSKKDVAAAIGATPETFSRLLLKLQREKKLIWRNRKVVLRKGFWRGWDKKKGSEEA